jgi:hypothetical protein
VSKSSDTFALSEKVVRSLERTCLVIGSIIDLIRGLTMAPMSDADREMVVALLHALEGYDTVREALTSSFSAVHNLAKDIERGSHHG